MTFQGNPEKTQNVALGLCGSSMATQCPHIDFWLFLHCMWGSVIQHRPKFMSLFDIYVGTHFDGFENVYGAFEDDLLFFDGVLFGYSFEYLLVFLLCSFLLKLQKHQLDDFVEDDKEVADYVHGG